MEPSKPRTITPEARETWNQVYRHLLPLYRNTNAGISSSDYMESYNRIFQICSQSSTRGNANSNQIQGQSIYDLLSEFFAKYISGVVQELRFSLKRDLVSDTSSAESLNAETTGINGLEISSTPGIPHNNTAASKTFLQIYQQRWTDFLRASKITDGIMAYLNRYWVSNVQNTDQNIVSVLLLALKIWKANLIDLLAPEIGQRLCCEINNERNGQIIQTRMVATCIQSLVLVGEAFLPPISTPVPGKVPSYRSSSKRKKGGSSSAATNESELLLGHRCNLTVYNEVFEQLYLKKTSDFYRVEAAQMIAQQTIVDYILYFDRRVTEEDKRVTQLLNNSSRKKVASVCDAVMIVEHTSKFQEVFVVLLNENKTTELRIVYRSLLRVQSGCAPLYDPFKQFLIDKITQALIDKIPSAPVAATAQSNTAAAAAATAAVSLSGTGLPADAAEKNPIEYIGTLLFSYATYRDLIKNHLDNSPEFVTTLQRAFTFVVNNHKLASDGRIIHPKSETDQPKRTCAHALAVYSDFLLKKNSKLLEDPADLEKKLDGIITLYLFLTSRDIFLKEYSKLLSSRLMNKSSSSEEYELSMVSKLKAAAGTDVTSKLQKMFQDDKMSKDFMYSLSENEIYKKAVNNLVKSYHHGKKIAFSTLVLTAQTWPVSQPSISFKLPTVLNEYTLIFKKCYNTQHIGRILTWLPNHSRAEIQTTYLKYTYTVMVSTYQLAILLCFNQSPSLSFKSIQASTDLPTAHLTGHLKHLSEITKFINLEGGVNVKPLTKFEDDDVFTLNMNYRNKVTRLNIIKTIKVDEDTDRETESDAVAKDRGHIIDAAIVRIMKMRKTLKHETLIVEVITQTKSRFRPDVSQIKARIEDLIEKDYLKRDANLNDLYKYLA